MHLQIFLFAGLAEKLGSSQISLPIPQDQITVEQLKQLLISQFPEAAEVIFLSFIAKNQAYAQPGEFLSAKDEIALIPPVSGGQADSLEELYTLSTLPI